MVIGGFPLHFATKLKYSINLCVLIIIDMISITMNIPINSIILLKLRDYKFMKLKLIAAALSISLVACVNTQETLQTSAKPLTTFATVIPADDIAPVQNNDQQITLEQIMADPDWFGRAPELWYWGDDSNTVFYKQKRLGNPLKDLWVKKLNSADTKQAQQVSLDNLHIVSDDNAQRNKDNSHEVYVFEGNVFVKNVAILQG